jgi:hypothetical protein
MHPTRVAVPESGHFHAVRFYENAESLSRMVAGFVAEGLIANHPGILIATPEHRQAILRQLAALGYDIQQRKARGDLIVLDARETLATFMVDGMPDAQRFEETMAPLIDRTRGGRDAVVVRAYGEMVDVLWKDHLELAAIRLEMFWNQLAQTRRFSLLCGYSMGSFYKNAGFEEVCSQHTHVVAPNGHTARLNAERVN